jgi:predicted protein tyrosine phosphatase
MRKGKLKVLCICAKGKNRSKYLAYYLKNKGYSTRYGGIDDKGYVVEKIKKKVDFKDVSWADIVIIVRKRLVPIFKDKFGSVKKRFIILDVTDAKNLIPEEFSHLRDLDYHSFQLRWTYPQLRKAIAKYLPLRL